MAEKKTKNKDALSSMETLLTRSLEPGTRLYDYMENELIEEKSEVSGGKPDPKPLKEVISVLQQIKELRETGCAGEITVLFSDPRGKSWSE